MKHLGILATLLGLCTCQVLSQTKAQVVQQAGDCSVNIAGNNNTTASLVCNGIDPELAKQVQAIISGTMRNQSALKEISKKLDRIIKEIDQAKNQVPVTQANSGGCNQQVIGGNNNRNVCATPPRELTDEQKSQLADAAEQIPKSIMVVVSSADDGESQNYAEEIRQVFLQHGTTRARGTMFGWHPKGIFIVVNPAGDSQYAQKLGYEMNQFGFSFKQIDVNTTIQKGEIHIWVGDQ
jgi:hypothetical protein